MPTVRRARLVSGIGVIVLVGCLVVIATSLARREAARAGEAGCADLGNAADFVVFSDGAFNSSQASGTSINGRIAAAGDVTLDGISVSPAAGDSTPTVIAGGDFVAGRTTGHGGTLSGGVRYGGSIDVAPNFTVDGERTHAPPPFSFVSEFGDLTALSKSWATIGQTQDATVTLDPNSKALQLTGKGSGLNVFSVSAADLNAAAGIVIDLSQADATALINITSAAQLTIAPQYMDLLGSANARRLVWNLPNATALAVTHGVSWKGLILAPNATATSNNRPQLSGQLIANTVPTSDWVLSYVPFTGCLPPVTGSPDLSSTASGSVRLGTAGASVSDVAHLSGGVTPTGTITFKLYGPNDDQCTRAPVFSSTSTATGAGHYGSESFAPQSAGTYRWAVDYSGDSNNSAAGPTACGADSETVRVSRAITALSTRVPDAIEQAGSEIYDTANLTDGVSPAGTLTFKLYGPGDAGCTQTPIFDRAVAVAGNGLHNSPGFTPHAAGTYRWVASYSGNQDNRPAGPTRCGDSRETVTLRKARPAISTEASAATAVGGQVSDTATLSNGSAPSGTVTFSLYGPGDARCSARPVHTSTVAVSNGNDTYSSDQFRPSSTGLYRWVARYSGDGNNTSAATGCGDLGENVNVRRPPPARPSISSTASAGVPAGQLVHDTAHLTGGSDPTGAISFRVYGPANRGCRLPLAGFSVVRVAHGNGDYRSASFRPRAPGVYRWVVRYSGDRGNRPAGPTACTAAGEEVVVSRARTALSTNASPGAGIGGAIHDTATLAGGSAPTGSVTFRLYGPDDATCSRAPAFVAQQRVFGNGQYQSPAFTPQDSGTYRWTARYSGNLSNAAAGTICDDNGEAVTIGRVRPSLSTSASPVATVGRGPRVSAAGLSIYDAATLSQGAQPTGEITFKLYGPNDARCTRAPVFTSATTVNGNGIYNSQRFIPTAGGIYRWRATYSGDANNFAVGPGSCGDRDEGVRITIPAVVSLTSSASAAVTIGGAVHDTAHLSGGSRPTGSIGFRLYGPTNKGCTGRPVFASTVTVTGNDDYASPAFTPDAAGKYRWVARYSGDARNRSAGPTGCDDVAEVAIVRPAGVDPAVPALSTTSSPSPALGAPIYDTAHLTAGLAPGGAITFELFGPDDQTCTGPPAFTATTTVNGNGSYRSAAFVVPQPGTYRWVASYSGDLGNTAAGPTSCTDAAETAVIGTTPGPTPDHGPDHGPNKRPRKPAHQRKPPPPPPPLVTG